MTSSTDTPDGATFTVTSSNGNFGGGVYIGDFPPAQQQWSWTPDYRTYPSTGTWPMAPRVAHATTDPTIVNHCPFCGSGALTGRSDGGVDCGVCNETFRVARQPLYSNEPSPESGAGVESFDNDPLVDEDPFEAPADAAVVPGEEDPAAAPEDPAAEEEGASNEEQALPDFFSLKSKSGVGLDVDDFLLHHALRSSRGE